MKLLKELMEGNVIDASSRFSRPQRDEFDDDIADDFDPSSEIHAEVERAQADYRRALLPLVKQIRDLKVFGGGNVEGLFNLLTNVKASKLVSEPQNVRRQLFLLSQNDHLFGLLADLNAGYEYLNRKHDNALDTIPMDPLLRKCIRVYEVIKMMREHF